MSSHEHGQKSSKELFFCVRKIYADWLTDKTGYPLFVRHQEEQARDSDIKANKDYIGSGVLSFPATKYYTIHVPGPGGGMETSWCDYIVSVTVAGDIDSGYTVTAVPVTDDPGKCPRLGTEDQRKQVEIKITQVRNDYIERKNHIKSLMNIEDQIKFYRDKIHAAVEKL